MAHHVKAHHNGTDADVVTVLVQVGDGGVTCGGCQVGDSSIQEVEPQSIVDNTDKIGISHTSSTHAQNGGIKRSLCSSEENLAITRGFCKLNELEKPRKRSRAIEQPGTSLPIPSRQIEVFASGCESFADAVDNIVAGNGNGMVSTVCDRGIKQEVSLLENEQHHDLDTTTRPVRCATNNVGVYCGLGPTTPQPDRGGIPAIEAIPSWYLGAQILNVQPTKPSERFMYLTPNSGEVGPMDVLVSQNNSVQTPSLAMMQFVTSEGQPSAVRNTAEAASCCQYSRGKVESNQGLHSQIDNSMGVFSGAASGLQNVQGSEVINAVGDSIGTEIRDTIEAEAYVHDSNIVEGEVCMEVQEDAINDVEGVSEAASNNSTETEAVCDVDGSNDGAELITEFEEINQILSALDYYSKGKLEVDVATIQSTNAEVQHFCSFEE